MADSWIVSHTDVVPADHESDGQEGYLPAAQAPASALSWRFQVVELPSRQWIDRDLDLIDPEVTTSVNGAAVIRGRLPLGSTTGRALKEWGHLLVADFGGSDPVVGIVDTIMTDGDWLAIEAGGFSQYPTGQPWVDEPYSGTNVDPLDIVRMIWSRLQSKPGGNLGVAVDTTKSAARIGTPESSARTAAKAAVAAGTVAAKAAKDAAVAAAKAQEAARVAVMVACGKTAAGFLSHQDSAPGGDKRSTKNVWIDKNNANKGFIWNGKKWVPQTTSTAAVVAAKVATWVASKTVTADAKKRSTASNKALTAAKKKLSDVKGGEADPWTMTWWETLDLGQVISTLATDTPFEWREKATWNGDSLALRLELGVPALGVRRSDLRFEIGVNVTAVPPLNARDYASEVTVLGAGEGRKMVRSTVAGNPGRLRRATVVQRKAIRKTADAGTAARAELAKHAAAWDLETLQVIDHPNAPYGSFAPGDRVYVTGDAGWVELDHWVRINDMTVNCTTGAITLKVEAG